MTKRRIYKRYHRGKKHGGQRYWVNRGSFFRKKPRLDDPDYPLVTSPEFKQKAVDYQYDVKEGYGKAKKIEGKTIGKGVAITGIIPGMPLPATIIAGKLIGEKVASVRIEHTDEHDRPYLIPRYSVEFKKKK